MSDYISRQAAIDALDKRFDSIPMEQTTEILLLRKDLRDLQSVQPERLTDDDFETIRIHLNAYKEELCNQRRWKEAGEYQRIIERFMAFASAQPETAKRIVVKSKDGMTLWYQCDMCNEPVDAQDNFCSECGRRLTDG